jgi:hypothetical protein
MGGTTISSAHVAMRRVHGTLEVRRAFRTTTIIATLGKRLRSRATIWLKTRFRTPRVVESAILTRTAELLRLLTAFRTMLGPMSAHVRTMSVHRTILWRTKSFPTALGKVLRPRMLRTQVEAPAFIPLRVLWLTITIGTTGIGIVASSITRWIGRAALTIALNLALRTAISITLAIHRRTTESFTRRTVVAATVLSAGLIGGTAFAITRRIGGTTLTIALKPVPWTISVTRTFHLRAVLRLVLVVFDTRRIVVTTLAFARLITTWLFTFRRRIFAATLFGRRWSARFGRFSGGFVRRRGFLGLQRSHAEGDDAAQPGEWVGSWFHESAVRVERGR